MFANDRVIGVKVLNNSGIVELLLYVYMPFYNGDISQTDLYLETTDVLQSIIDEYAAVSPIHIMGDLNVRLPIQQMLHKNWYKKSVATTGILTSCITLSMTTILLLLI